MAQYSKFREIGQEIHKPKQRAQRQTYRKRQQVDLKPTFSLFRRVRKIVKSYY